VTDFITLFHDLNCLCESLVDLVGVKGDGKKVMQPLALMQKMVIL